MGRRCRKVQSLFAAITQGARGGDPRNILCSAGVGCDDLVASEIASSLRDLDGRKLVTLCQHIPHLKRAEIHISHVSPVHYVCEPDKTFRLEGCHHDVVCWVPYILFYSFRAGRVGVLGVCIAVRKEALREITVIFDSLWSTLSSDFDCLFEFFASLVEGFGRAA